jgi:hypothetical protein
VVLPSGILTISAWGRIKRHVLLTQRNDVLPNFIIFRHHLAPGIQRFTARSLTVSPARSLTDRPA